MKSTKESQDIKEELQRKEHNLREVTSRSVELQEEERRQIARDLHDAAGQTLTAIRINLQLLADGLTRTGGGDERALELARRTTSLVDETVEEIRRAVQSLGASVLEDVGLVRAIERMCDDVADRTGIVFVYSVCAFLPLIGILAVFLPNLDHLGAPSAPASD